MKIEEAPMRLSANALEFGALEAVIGGTDGGNAASPNGQWASGTVGIVFPIERLTRPETGNPPGIG
jgi:hypothetical protein